PSRLRRLEPTGPMGAVAKRLALRLTTAAQGDVVFARRQREFVAEMVQHTHRSFEDQRPVFPTANHERLRHGALAQKVPSRRACATRRQDRNTVSPYSTLS